MVLRFHFSGQDYGKVVLGRVNPLWELTLSLHVLANGSGRPALQAWRVRASARLEALGLSRDVRQLMELAPEAPYFPDFLTPDVVGLEEGLRRVAATPAPQVSRDLERLAGVAPVPALGARLAHDGGVDRLVAILKAYFEAVIAPTSGRISGAVDHDLQWRGALFQSKGALSLLDSFDPAVLRFREPLLTVKSPDGDVHLDGVGVRLVPSYFCRQAPISNCEFTGPPTVVYQAGSASTLAVGSVPAPGARRADPEGPLGKLIGSSRCAVLVALRDPASTTALAAHLSLAPSTVNAHLGVLHATGLVSKHRHEHEVLYSLTPRGAALIRPL